MLHKGRNTAKYSLLLDHPFIQFSYSLCAFRFSVAVCLQDVCFKFLSVSKKLDFYLLTVGFTSVSVLQIYAALILSKANEVSEANVFF